MIVMTTMTAEAQNDLCFRHVRISKSVLQSVYRVFELVHIQTDVVSGEIVSAEAVPGLSARAVNKGGHITGVDIKVNASIPKGDAGTVVFGKPSSEEPSERIFDWKKLVSCSTSAEAFFRAYFRLCMYFREDFDSLLLKSLEGDDSVESEWPRYAGECELATSGADSRDGARTHAERLLQERFPSCSLPESMFKDFKHAVSNINARMELACKFRGGIQEIGRWGRVRVVVSVDSQADVATGNGMDYKAWAQFVWVTHAVAIRMRLAAEELSREIEPWGKSAAMHGGYLESFKVHWTRWMEVLRKSSAESSKRIQLGFTPIFKTLSSALRYLNQIVEKLNRPIDGPESSIEFDQVKSRVEDISDCMGLLLEELYQRHRFSEVSRTTEAPLNPKILCYKGSSDKFPVIAQCINYDIVESGSNVELAVNKVIRLIEAARGREKGDTFVDLPPAPVSFQRRYRKSMAAPGATCKLRGFEICCDDVPILSGCQ